MSLFTLSPRESGRFISETAENVKINMEAVKKAAENIAKLIKEKTLSISGGSQSDLHPKIANEEAINWIFVVDTLNYCFWSPNGDHWNVTWRGKTYSGYFALCAAINRALDEGYSITNPQYYSQISLRDLKTILRGDNDFVSIPLLNKRLDCLHEVGLTLLERFDGKFLNCIRESNGSAEKLLYIIVNNFPCFKDEAFYQNKRVSFYKRAQILIGDLWICFSGKDEGSFYDIEKLTMFADYRVPQVLVHFNILEYNNYLMDKLKNGVFLESGSKEEVEIRGCSIHAVELINEEIKKLKSEIVSNISENFNEGSLICNSILIDHYLWQYRREHASELESVPFHKTLCIYY